ncbi:MAG: type II secretion system F family protein [Turicibacter sp.]
MNRKLSRLIDVFEGDDKEEKKFALDVSLLDKNYVNRIKLWFRAFFKVFQPNAGFRICLFFILSSIFLWWVNDLFLRFEFFKVYILLEPVLFFIFFKKLKNNHSDSFKKNFPDALNILASALSSGQSVVYAFTVVGEELDNEVGKEFEYMANRLLIGQSPEDVLEDSCLRFPYLEYFFFISAVRVNLRKGGQLKEVITKINRLIFVSQRLEKKKMSLTSEARSSAKIIAVLPIVFLLLLKFLNPENYEFVMFEEGGKPILYYVVSSICIGFFIIWLILQGANND